MTHRTLKTLDELMAEEEAAAIEKAQTEIACEDAAWAALPEEEKLAIIAAREALKSEPVPCPECGETECHLSYCDDEDDETTTRTTRMSDENKTAALLLAVLAVQIWLGWTLGRAESVMDNKPDCERYWQQMSVYLRTENEADLPEFLPECSN